MIAPLLLFAAVAADWSGIWVYRVEGHPLLVLTLDDRGGSIIKPKSFSLSSEGEVSKVSSEIVREAVKWINRGRKLRVGDDLFVINFDAGHATLSYAEAPSLALVLERARQSDNLTVPSPWPDRQYPPEIVQLQKQLAAMVKVDQQVRLSLPIAQARLDEIDRANRAEIERVFATYGWPKWSVVGKAAAHDFWLLVQHQDDVPELQRRVLDALERAVAQGEASRSQYAYLYDRVREHEGKLQRWGTQTKCVNALPVPSPVEDPAGLDARRRELGMMPMREYLKGLKPFCASPR